MEWSGEEWEGQGESREHLVGDGLAVLSCCIYPSFVLLRTVLRYGERERMEINGDGRVERESGRQRSDNFCPNFIISRPSGLSRECDWIAEECRGFPSALYSFGASDKAERIQRGIGGPVWRPLCLEAANGARLMRGWEGWERMGDDEIRLFLAFCLVASSLERFARCFCVASLVLTGLWDCDSR